MKTKLLLKFQCIKAIYVCPGIQHMEFPLSFKCEVPFRLLAFSRSILCSLQLPPFAVTDYFLMLSIKLKFLDMRALFSQHTAALG